MSPFKKYSRICHRGQGIFLAMAMAGITDFRFHDLRHTYASHLAMRGVHIRALQELLGHKSVIMTQRYSHLSPEHLQNAVKLLDGVIGERRV
jgi:site-specific recombinase XerD